VIRSPLTTTTLFSIGPVPISQTVVATWGLMAALALGSWIATRSLTLTPSRRQTVLELIVGAIEDQILWLGGIHDSPESICCFGSIRCITVQKIDSRQIAV